MILSDIEQRIKAKIEAIGTPLKDWDINIYRGILTGYNEAFIIDKAKKGEIFKENKILNKNSGKIGFDTFRLKLVESNWTLIPFLHDFDEVLG